MAKLTKKRSKKAGLPPGTLIHIGEKKTEKVKITIVEYDEMHFREQEAKTIEECFPLKDKNRPSVAWINIDGKTRRGFWAASAHCRRHPEYRSAPQDRGV